MRRARSWIALAACAAFRAAPAAAGLEDLLLPAHGSWEVVNEAPQDAARDPDLVRWGVRETRVRHYTRREPDGVRVCSIELWAFASERQARLAGENLSYPGWSFERRGSHLLMAHGLVRTRGERDRPGLFPACTQLAQRIAARLGPPAR
jgi:hypothetical protein